VRGAEAANTSGGDAPCEQSIALFVKVRAGYTAEGDVLRVHCDVEK